MIVEIIDNVGGGFCIIKFLQSYKYYNYKKGEIYDVKYHMHRKLDENIINKIMEYNTVFANFLKTNHIFEACQKNLDKKIYYKYFIFKFGLKFGVCLNLKRDIKLGYYGDNNLSDFIDNYGEDKINTSNEDDIIKKENDVSLNNEIDEYNLFDII